MVSHTCRRFEIQSCCCLGLRPSLPEHLLALLSFVLSSRHSLAMQYSVPREIELALYLPRQPRGPPHSMLPVPGSTTASWLLFAISACACWVAARSASIPPRDVCPPVLAIDLTRSRFIEVASSLTAAVSSFRVLRAAVRKTACASAAAAARRQPALQISLYRGFKMMRKEHSSITQRTSLTARCECSTVLPRKRTHRIESTPQHPHSPIPSTRPTGHQPGRRLACCPSAAHGSTRFNTGRLIRVGRPTIHAVLQLDLRKHVHLPARERLRLGLRLGLRLRPEW
jgi:hypothetical protein